MSASLSNCYGNKLVQEKGREAALVVAKGLAEKQQGPTIYGVLSRGSTEDDGPTWLLENLAKIDPAVEFDRRLLVVGTAQRLVANGPPAKGMDWAAQLPGLSSRVGLGS
jgi:hypothetical protein